MIKILFVIGLTLWISTAYGIIIREFFNLRNEHFNAPIGFAALLFTLQVLYYPAQLFNWPSYIIHGISTVVYGILLIASLWKIPNILKQYVTFKSLWIVAYVMLFAFMFYHMSIAIARADGQMYLNYIAQNMDIDQLNKFNLWTGLTGSEFVSVYFFQGYYHFASFLNVFVNSFSKLLGIGSSIDSIVVSTWGMGLLLATLSSLMILNFVDYFNYKNPWIKAILIIFSLFYTNFYYWKVAFSFYGNSYRSLFMAMMMFYIYRLIKEQNLNDRYTVAIVFGASLAASSSTLFIGFSFLLGLAYHWFRTNRETSLEDLSVMAFPMVLYVLALQYKDHFTVFLILFPITLMYYGFRFTKPVKTILHFLNQFFIRYSFRIFIILIPIGAMVFSFIDMKMDIYYPWHLFHYFDNHANYDMVKDYLFLYSSSLENLLNILRWLAILVLIVKHRTSKENRYVADHFLVLAVLFLNPLATSFVSKAFASNVYYRLFESLFNAFSEILLFGLLLNTLWNQKVVRWVLSFILLWSVFDAHYSSYIVEENTSPYGFYIKQGHDVLPLYKIKGSELDVIRSLQTELADHPISDHQVTVISHADGLRTFLPKVYQVFTPREYYTPGDRVNEEFYQLARLWYSWEEMPNLDYSKSCSYLQEFKIDYVISERYINYKFDGALNDCTQVIYQNAEFNLRKVIQP